MLSKLLSTLGVLASVFSLWAATRLFPGGYDWNRDYISTLLRGPAGSARSLADVAVFLYTGSMALVFVRLARVSEFSKHAQMIRIAGIGSQVYAFLAITPMHDLMVTIAFLFSSVAVFAITQALYVSRQTGFFYAGCACLVVLLGSAVVYYSGYLGPVLAWGQKAWLVLLAVWLLSLDWNLPRLRLHVSEHIPG